MQKSKSSRENSDQHLIDAVAQLIQDVRRIEPDYAARAVPLVSSYMWRLINRSNCSVHDVDMPSQLELGQEIVHAGALPMIGGKFRLGLRKGDDVFRRMFGIRHEYAHVQLGDTQAPDGSFIALADRHYMTWSERAADLFALADLIPGRQLAAWRAASTDEEFAHDLLSAVADPWGADWPAERLADRATLRFLLFTDRRV